MKSKSIFFILVFLVFIGSCKNSPTTPAVSNSPTISNFSLSPTSINKGESATLSWNVTNANSVSIDQGIGSVAASGSKSVTPDKDTVYTLTASNNGGTITKSCEIKVKQPPKPGEWAATTAFGSFDFIVDSTSTSITQITLNFSNWKGRSGSVRISKDPPWSITNRSFKIEAKILGDQWTIEGTFAESGEKASGTWKAIISGQTESGSWEASPKS